MVCERFDLVCRHIDDDLTPDESREFQQHLKSCRECQAAVLSVRDREGAIRASVWTALAGRNLAEKVMTRVANEPAPKAAVPATASTWQGGAFRQLAWLIAFSVIVAIACLVFIGSPNREHAVRGTEFVAMATGADARIGTQALANGQRSTLIADIAYRLRGPLTVGMPAGNRVAFSGEATLALADGEIDWLDGQATFDFTLIRPVAVRIGAQRLEISGTAIEVKGRVNDRVTVKLLRGVVDIVGPSSRIRMVPGTTITVVSGTQLEGSASRPIPSGSTGSGSGDDYVAIPEPAPTPTEQQATTAGSGAGMMPSLPVAGSATEPVATGTPTAIGSAVDAGSPTATTTTEPPRGNPFEGPISAPVPPSGPGGG